MTEQIKKESKPEHKKGEIETSPSHDAEAGKAAKAKHDEAVSKIDDILDEIDELLEDTTEFESAAEFVQAFQQKGGQ